MSVPGRGVGQSPAEADPVKAYPLPRRQTPPLWRQIPPEADPRKQNHPPWGPNDSHTLLKTLPSLALGNKMEGNVCYPVGVTCKITFLSCCSEVSATIYIFWFTFEGGYGRSSYRPMVQQRMRR